MTNEDLALARATWDDLPRRLLIEEAAAIARVSDRSVRRWIAVAYIRATKPAGGRVLVDRDSLRAFLDPGDAA